MLSRILPALALAVLSAACARTGRAVGPLTSPRPETALRFPAADGLLLAALPAAITTPWDRLDAETQARFDGARWEALRTEQPSRAELLSYASGGLRVGALLVRPTLDSGRRSPVVLVCRDGLGGDPLDVDTVLAELDHWAREGYVALATTYRGSRLSQGTDSAGSPDDVLALALLAADLGYADPARVYVVGYGAGGERTLAALRGSDRFRAAAVVRTGPETADGARGLPAGQTPDSAEGLDEPLLLVQSARGRAAAWHQTLAAALTARGTEHRVHTLAAEAPAAARAEADDEVAAWFAAHGGRSLLN